ncbi:unnamed protein product [Vitrella brassicaformis CCMP3155]|uniref:Carrier domain-containing protein n=2 Tax=Vitrella brassicaformis TaxID=1169539 RepID=A0A0G4G443_VITBC|nr:unnamed protein product [Vitrella brassicaformis CCMP3155]|eukprot:CEM22855.1 unnamed protein product [Vitrella brassicaformis CCMP3155]
MGATIDLTLHDSTGQVLAAIKHLNLRQMDATPVAEIPKELLWHLEWQPALTDQTTTSTNEEEEEEEEDDNQEEIEARESQPTDTQEAESTPPMRCLVFGMSSELKSDLASSGAEARVGLGLAPESRLLAFGELPSDSELEALLAAQEDEATGRQYLWDAILYLGGLLRRQEASEVDVLNEALCLTQAMLALGRKVRQNAPPMWLVTSGVAQPSEEQSAADLDLVAHAGLWGFAKSARLELEANIGRRIQLGCIDLHTAGSHQVDPSSVASLIATVQTEKRKPPNAYESEIMTRGEADKPSVLYSRLRKSALPVRGAMELFLPRRGALSNLKLRPLAEASRIAPPAGCVEVRVRAVGLNFRDVLNVMGLYPGDPGPPGGDCSGTVVSVGAGVTHLSVGDDVYGVAPGCLRTYVATDAHLMAIKPVTMSFEQAAALPVVFVTVQVAFRELAKVTKGDKVLVHVATGGVGLAALQYCQQVGATVFATAGSEAKRDYLRQTCGVQYVTTSRDAKQFKEDMLSFLGGASSGKIDVVLNSLIDDYIPFSLDLMAPNGRFMELGKRETWTKDKVAEKRPDVMYELIAVDRFIEENPLRVETILQDISAGIAARRLQPLPLHVFDMTSQDQHVGGVAGFRFLQRAQHIGKVVLSVPTAIQVETVASSQGSGSYVITGGSGGLGLLLADWLVHEGAKHIVLLSRRGKPSAAVAATDLWQRLTAASNTSFKVHSVAADVSRKDDCERLFQQVAESIPDAPVKGIFHAAGVLEDATLNNQTKDNITKVYLPKVMGAWYLHELSQTLPLHLDHFMLFSSVASLLGNFGQSNYSAANACLDALTVHRRSRGLAAQSIQWGPWVEQGMAAKLRQHLDKVGIKGISNELGLRVMGDVMSHQLATASRPGVGVIGCQALNWPVFLRRHETVPSLFADIPMASTAAADGKGSLDLSRMSRDDLGDILCSLAEEVAGSGERPEPDAPLMELGFDSLGAVEFRNAIADMTGVKLPQSLVFENPSINDLADFILSRAATKSKDEPSDEAAEGADGQKTTAEAIASVTGIPADIMSLTVEEWLRFTFSKNKRYFQYVDAFENKYPSVDAMSKESDVHGAIRSLNVKNADDTQLIAAAWERLISADTTEAKPGRKQKTPDVYEDMKMLSSWLDAEIAGRIKSALPPVPQSQVRRVLLTGVTGFVGRCQLVTLLEREKPGKLFVYCLVRASSVEHGLQRIRQACTEARIWREEFTERIEVLPGDFTLQDFGLGEEKFQELCRSIDMVYHTGADVNLMNNYAKLRHTNTLAMKGVIRLCATHRLKELHHTSTLGVFPAFYAAFGQEFSRMSPIMEGVSPDEKEMKKFFPPTAIGYPWSKWATEQTLRKARDMGLPLCIYRLPNTNLSLRTGFTNRTDYLTALMVSSMQEGMFPIGATAAPFTPADTISEMLVEASFLENRKHWFYHLVDATVVTRHELERWSADMGVSYRGVQYQEFLNAVKERGRASPIHRFVPLMQHWRRYWFDSEERTEPLPISNKHIFEDLPNFKWPSGRDVFQASFMYSCEARFFMPNSKSIGMVADDMVALAKKNAGLDTLPHGLPGGDAFFTQPIRSLTDSAREDVKLSFFGQFALSRSVHQLLKNALFLQAMEQQHPDILRQPISQPLVIVGPDVLSTTFLQLLMAQDPSNRVPRFCEVNFPYGEDGSFRPEPLPNNAPWEQDPRMAAAQRLLESSPMLGNEYTSILPRSGDMPDDDTAIFEHSLRAHTFCMGYGAPSYGEWLKASDGTEIKKGYAMHKRFLQHLQWQRAGDRWVLKMPAHMLALDALFETYPDARVIFLHRDPKVALGPVCKIVSSVREKLMDDADVTVTSHQQAELMAEMVNTAAAFRRDHPALKGRFVDVTHDALLRDPVGTLKKVYRQCGLSMSRRASHSMWEFINQHRDKRDQLFRQVEPLDQFGIDEDELDEALQPYHDSRQVQQARRGFSRLLPTCGANMRRPPSRGERRGLTLPSLPRLPSMPKRRSESYRQDKSSLQ